MKKLLIALALISTSLAYAQKVPQNKVSVEITCFPLSDFRRVLDAYDEEPVFSMNTIVRRNGQLIDNETIFTLNMETGDWTVYRQIDDETVCVQAAGDSFNILGGTGSTKKSKKDML